MTAAQRLGRLDRRWFGMIAASLMLLMAIVDDRAVLRGLFAGFLLLVAVPTGSMLLLLIHRLTGGRWGEALRPRLVAAAAVLPAVALLLVPVLLFPPAVFPWAADPSLVRHEDVADWYLNRPSFALRSIATLLIWSAFALLAVQRPGRLTAPLAGLGLALFGLTVSVVALDWVLSLDPAFKSTAFAMSLSIAFLLAGAGFAAAAGAPAAARRDLAKLMAAFSLGLLYLDLMQFIVAYDGNLPDKAAWYLRRATPVGIAALALAFTGAALVPFVAVMRERWRGSAAAQRLVGLSVLVGLAARTLWWTVPEWEASIILWLALLSTPVVALGLDAAVGRSGRKLPAAFRRRLSHGA